MSELLPCFSCGGPVDWCMCDEEGCHRIRCDACQYEFEHFVDSSPVGDELSSADWTANERRRTLPVWNTRTPASPASKPSGAGPAIEVGATFNRRLDAVRVEDYEKAIAEFRSYGNVDDADALIGRAIAFARQRASCAGQEIVVATTYSPASEGAVSTTTELVQRNRIIP